MRLTITVTLSDDVYHQILGDVGQITGGRVVEIIVRSTIIDEQGVLTGYSAMAADVEREHEAMEWLECDPPLHVDKTAV